MTATTDDGEKCRSDRSCISSDLEILVVCEVRERPVDRMEDQQPIWADSGQRGRPPLMECRRPFDRSVLVAWCKRSQADLVVQRGDGNERSQEDDHDDADADGHPLRKFEPTRPRRRRNCDGQHDDQPQPGYGSVVRR